MKQLTISIVLLSLYFNVSAQAGVSIIATSNIGKDDLYQSDPGRADTPLCLFPGGACSTGFAVYIFTGEGNWDNPANWKDFIIPPAALPAHFEIIIDPKGSEECVLNIPLQVIQAGATITVATGKKLRMPVW